jgi:ribosomal-protein-alanine N-acetyltransferase
MRWWDVSAVMELERVLFPEEPWTAEGFWAELAMGPDRVYLVAEGPAQGVVGYAGLSCAARARGGDAEVMTVGVAPGAQGSGVGRTLVAALRAAAEERGAGRLLLEVRADNELARGLYSRLGLEEIGRRAAYYRGSPGDAASGRVDALVLALRLPRTADSVSR